MTLLFILYKKHMLYVFDIRNRHFFNSVTVNAYSIPFLLILLIILC